MNDLYGFEWDKGNITKNLKHGVSVKECEEVFFNGPFLKKDVTHSEVEERFFALGSTDVGRLLLVVFTRRGTNIRVISAREMSRKERKFYEREKIKKDTSV